MKDTLNRLRDDHERQTGHNRIIRGRSFLICQQCRHTIALENGKVWRHEMEWNACRVVGQY